jgi:hypothetical protein
VAGRRADGAFRREVALKFPMLAHARAGLEARFARERDTPQSSSACSSLCRSFCKDLPRGFMRADFMPLIALRGHGST